MRASGPDLLNSALGELAAMDPPGRVVEMRFFGGPDTAESPIRVSRHRGPGLAVRADL
jgi:hypothetical protein